MPIPDEATIPEHYKLFMKEIEPYIEQVRAALKYKSPTGTPFEEVSHTKAFIDSQAFKNITDSILSLSLRILAVESVSENTITLEADRFGSAVKYYLALFETLRSKPFPTGYETGHPLLVAFMRKPLQDLLDAMDQIAEIIAHKNEFVARHGSLVIKIVVKFDVESEQSRFQKWIDSVEAENHEANVSYSRCAQPKKSSNWFWGILGGIALFDIFFDKD